jgi:hypothetical protein
LEISFHLIRQGWRRLRDLKQFIIKSKCRRGDWNDSNRIGSLVSSKDAHRP